MQWVAYLALPLVLLSGCTCTPVGEEPEQIHVSETAGTVRHTSGFEFPEKVDEFVRVDVHNYDQTGDDLSAGYNLDAHFIAATVYVYPTAHAAPRDSLEQHFKDVWENVMSEHPGAQADEQEKFTLRQGKLAFEGLKRVYVEGPKTSETYLFVLNNYFVKYRFTYPTDLKADARKSIDAFMMNLYWPS